MIEENVDLTASCECVLRSVGFEVETFVEGKPAYERLSVEPAPWLVLVDLELPNISGLEITREIWLNLDGSRIIIIAPNQKTAAIDQNKDGVNHVLMYPRLTPSHVEGSAAALLPTVETTSSRSGATLAQDLCRRIRHLLTLKARPPFRLAGLEMVARLGEVEHCLERLLVHHTNARIVGLSAQTATDPAFDPGHMQPVM